MPLVTINWRADLASVIVKLPPRDCLNVFNQVVPGDLDGAVVLPPNRVTDLWRELRELGKGLLLGLVSHPVQGLDALLIGLNQVVNERIHLLLRLRREMLLDIDLADCLSEAALDQRNRSLPARTVHRSTGQLLAIELETLSDQVYG